MGKLAFLQVQNESLWWLLSLSTVTSILLPGGGYCWLTRDREPITLLEIPVSPSLFILDNFMLFLINLYSYILDSFQFGMVSSSWELVHTEMGYLDLWYICKMSKFFHFINRPRPLSFYCHLFRPLIICKHMPFFHGLSYNLLLQCIWKLMHRIWEELGLQYLALKTFRFNYKYTSLTTTSKLLN